MNINDCSDQELLVSFRNNNELALDVLIRRYERRVYSYVLMMVRRAHIAEDIVQDTFIKVVKSLRENAYSDENKMLPWIMRIAHNLVIDHFRRCKKQGEVYSADHEESIFNSARFSENNAEQNMVYAQVMSDVRELIDKLPMEQREVVLLRYYGDLSFKEIAELTQVSINTALGRMRYAIINMRKVIDSSNLSLRLG